jgi:glycosyltransferase involved in cell wall biosynthesis
MEKLRIAMIARDRLFSIPGGDSTQVLQTALGLRGRGMQVDILKASGPIDYRAYDLFHFFNLGRPADILHHLPHIQKPLVVSPIYVEYSEFDRFHRGGWQGRVFRTFPASWAEYLKYLGRWSRRGESRLNWPYLLKGHRPAIRAVLGKTSLLLPNSHSEASRLSRDYGRIPPVCIVPNGVDQMFFKDSSAAKDPSLVICAARIEGIKNQLGLIRALNHSPYRLLLAGAPAPNQPDYYHACRREAAPNIDFLGRLGQEALRDLYRRAAVHVLPSFFETTGLSSLEAVAMGCNIVVTDRGDTREYFGEHAFYCEPESPASILAAVQKAASCCPGQEWRQQLMQRCNWEQATETTINAYQSVIHPYDIKNRNSRNPGNPQQLWRL